MKTAYVTGGTGCVGRNVIDELLREGWNVIAAHRKSFRVSRLSGLDIELREVDLHDVDSVRQSVREELDAIFQVAGNTSHWPLEAKEQWRDNVLADAQLGASCNRRESSVSFTRRPGPPHPTRVLRRKKRRGSHRLMFAPNDCQSWRYATGFNEDSTPLSSTGHRVRCLRLQQLLENLHCDGSRESVGLAGRDRILPRRDVAIAHIRVFEKGRTGESYGLGGHHSTWLDVYLKIATLFNVLAPNSETPVWVLYAISYPLLWISYLTRKKPLITPQLVHLLRKGGITDFKEVLKSRNELGYQSASIDEMIDDCYTWLVGEGLVGRRREPGRPLGAVLAEFRGDECRGHHTHFLTRPSQ